MRAGTRKSCRPRVRAGPRRKPRSASVGGVGAISGPPQLTMQAIADGILTGAVIALGAIGVTFTLGIMRFANFAHSELLTWGAYFALVVVAFAGPGAPTGPFSFGWQLVAAALVAAVPDRARRVGRRRARVPAVETPRRSSPHDGLRGVRGRARDAPPGRPGLGTRVALLHARIANGDGGAAGSSRAPGSDLHRRPGPGGHDRPARVPDAEPYRHGDARDGGESGARAGVRHRGRGVVRLTWIISGALAAFAGVFIGLTPQIHPEIGFNVLLSLFAAAILGGTGSLPAPSSAGFWSASPRTCPCS